MALHYTALCRRMRYVRWSFCPPMEAVRPLFDLCSTVLLLYLWGTSMPSRERS
jgi:hypothetical protein